MSLEAMKMALEALELLRSGLIQMRRHSEEYGRAWAGAYVEEYQKLLSGSAVEQFRILNVLQDRLADVDEAVVDGYQAIASLRLAIAEAEKQEPVAQCSYPKCQATNGCVGACSKTAPVHAIDISQERVDETAKHEHEWVGLTDEEIQEMRLKTLDSVATNYETYKAIEAKLKEKNT